VLLVGSNILLLTADAVYDAAKRGLWSLASVVTSVGTPTTHRGNRETLARLTAQTEMLEVETQRLESKMQRSRHELAELTTENEMLERRSASFASERAALDRQLRGVRRELSEITGENTELASERARLSRRVAELEVQASEIDGRLRERVRVINDRLATRTSRMISTNMSSMAIEAVPYVGVAAIVGVTFMEVRDACRTLADTREISILLSGEPAASVPACGYSPREFWEVLQGGPDPATCRNWSDDMPAELRLDCLQIVRPGDGAPRPPESVSVPVDDILRPGE
jgi:chaperonin cofactor prefoldin